MLYCAGLSQRVERYRLRVDRPDTLVASAPGVSMTLATRPLSSKTGASPRLLRVALSNSNNWRCALLGSPSRSRLCNSNNLYSAARLALLCSAVVSSALLSSKAPAAANS